MINEKGLCKILKSAYKGSGYTIIPQTFLADGPAGGYRSNEIVLNGSTWAIRCLTVDLPSEAAVQIVKDAGYLPVEAMLIQKGAPNQLVMEQTATARYGMLQRQGEEVLAMKKIPVIFKERWQLYQTEKGGVHAFDLELLNLIDFKGWDPPSFMSAHGHLGIWMQADYAVYLAPGRFSAADEEKIRHVAALDWENQIEHDDPAANISLFDEERDEPLAEQEE